MQSVQSESPVASSGTRSRRRNLLWQCLLAVAMLLAFVAWKRMGHRGDPEMFRFPAPASGNRYLICKGQVIWRTGQDRLVIHSIPVMGGKEKILAEDSAEFAPPSWVFGLMFAKEDILYQTQRNQNEPLLASASVFGRIPDAQNARRNGKAGAALKGAPSTQLSPSLDVAPAEARPPSQPISVGASTFLADPMAVRPGEQRKQLAAHPPFPTRLRRVPLTGGVPRDVLGVTASWNTTVGGEWVYWLRTRPDDLQEVRRGKEVWNEIAGKSDLMYTSLKTGETRQGAGGLAANTYLHADERGVFWTAPHVYPDRHQTLYYLHPGDSAPTALSDFTGNLEALPPVEFEGRLYWLVSDTPNILWRGDKLCSARLDGSDAKVLLTRARSGKLLRQPLTVYRGRLYMFLQDDNLVQVVHRSKDRLPPAIALCRLHPERQNPVEIVQNSVFGFNFDEDYLYFERTIEHRPLRDYLISDGMSTEEEQIICRYRLPQ